MFKIIYKKTAQKHLEKIANWYFQQQNGLEKRFLDEVDDVSDVLSINPFFVVRYMDVRTYVMKNFPYIIFFRIDEKTNTVKVLSVLHTARNPNKKYPK